MNFKLKRPCESCPFRSDIKGFLRSERAHEIVWELLHDGSFLCHKTLDYDKDDPSLTSEASHCAGAMIFLEKQQLPNQMMRIAERLGFYNFSELDLSAPVFSNAMEFVDHHADNN